MEKFMALHVINILQRMRADSRILNVFRAIDSIWKFFQKSIMVMHSWARKRGKFTFNFSYCGLNFGSVFPLKFACDV